MTALARPAAEDARSIGCQLGCHKCRANDGCRHLHQNYYFATNQTAGAYGCSATGLSAEVDNTRGCSLWSRKAQGSIRGPAFASHGSLLHPRAGRGLSLIDSVHANL